MTQSQKSKQPNTEKGAEERGDYRVKSLRQVQFEVHFVVCFDITTPLIQYK